MDGGINRDPVASLWEQDLGVAESRFLTEDMEVCPLNGILLMRSSTPVYLLMD